MINDQSVKDVENQMKNTGTRPKNSFPLSYERTTPKNTLFDLPNTKSNNFENSFGFSRPSAHIPPVYSKPTTSMPDIPIHDNAKTFQSSMPQTNQYQNMGK